MLLSSQGKTSAQAETAFDFLYNQGLEFGNKEGAKEKAINAAIEMYGDGHKSMYEAFFAAGDADFNNRIRGRRGAGLVKNKALRYARSHNLSAKAERVMNTISKRIGFDIEFVDEIEGGGDASFDTKTGKFLVSKDAKNPVLSAVVHDSVHAGRSVDPETYNKLADVVVEILGKDSKVLGDAYANRLALYKKEATDKDGHINKDYVTEEMVSEVVGRVLSLDKAYMKKLANEDRGLIQKIIDTIRDFFGKAIGRYKGEDGGMSPEIREAVKMLEDESKRIIRAYETLLGVASSQRGYKVKGAKSGEVMKSTGNNVITREDVKLIQSIGRKSINELTEAELKILEPIAKKYFGDMGVKSPFFRRWFGDWRANDTKTKIKTVLVETISLDNAILENGDYTIADTNWVVHAGTTLSEETNHYARGKKISVRALNSIKNILNNAILFDTEVSVKDSTKKSQNTILMHKFYTPIIYGGKMYIAKTSVEEFLDEGTDSIKRKAYHLHAIKIELADGDSEAKTSTVPRSDTNSIDNISDLFQLVKTYDKDFKPVPSSLVLNENGTPKVVYHGTSEKFTEFDITKSRSWDRVPDYDLPGFYFSENIEEGMSYGDTRSFYIKITKPYEGDVYSLAKEKGSYRDAYEYLVKEGYDGLIVDDMGEGFAEYIVLKSNNIKSVENGGTFSSWDNDIMKSKPDTATEDTSEPYIPTTSSFEIDKADKAKLDELVGQYGAIKKGVAPARDVTIPKRTDKDRYVRQTTRTVIESDRISDEAAKEITRSIAEGNSWVSYERLHNGKLWNEATNILKTEGYEKMLQQWDNMVDSGELIRAKDMMKAYVLMEEASRRGDTKTVVKLTVDVSSINTTAAQLVQMTMALKKLGTAANVYKIERTVSNLQRDLNKKYGDKAPKLKVSKGLMEDYAEAFDAEVRGDKNAINKMADLIAKQVPGMSRDDVLDMLDSVENESIETPSHTDVKNTRKQKWVNQEEYYRAVDELTETLNELWEKENIMTNDLDEINRMQKQIDRVQRKITKLSEDLTDAEDVMFSAENEYDKAMDE